MAQSAGVQDALNQYYMIGRTSNLYTFGGLGYVAAGANPVAQFVGFLQVEHPSEQWRYPISRWRTRQVSGR